MWHMKLWKTLIRNNYVPTNPIHDILHKSILWTEFSSAELNNFLKSHRIINVEKRLIDGERGTGWVFLVEYTENEGGKSAYTKISKVDWRDVLNPSQFAVYDLLRKTRKEIGDKTKIPLYGILSKWTACLNGQKSTKNKRRIPQDKRCEWANDSFYLYNYKNTLHNRYSVYQIV